MNEFKQFILSPQYLGPVWPGLRSWSEDRQMESVMALISLLVDHANQL